jgi:hypothetical protein
MDPFFLPDYHLGGNPTEIDRFREPKRSIPIRVFYSIASRKNLVRLLR